MEITPVDDGSGNVVRESLSSKSSTVSEFEKDVGNAHILQKSASMEQEESSRMVSESVSQVSSSRITSSVVKQSVSKSFSSVSSSTTTQSISFD